MVSDTLTSDLELLAEQHGIAAGYLDYRKKQAHISLPARLEVLQCMGVEPSESVVVSELAKRDQRRRQQENPATLLILEGENSEIPISLPIELSGNCIRCFISMEGKNERHTPHSSTDLNEIDTEAVDGQLYSRRLLNIDCELPVGYHKFRVQGGDGATLAKAIIIVTPKTCYQPFDLMNGNRIFGISVQLYTVRSSRNWGMGDFTDLRNFLVGAAGRGVDIVGLNPLHALFPANPLHFSPYSPSNRSFLNVMYLDIEAVAEYQHSEGAQRRVNAPDFQQALTGLRETARVDYAGVARCKFEILEILYADFICKELAMDTARAQSFKQYVADQGEALELHATYDSLHEYFFNQSHNLWGWPVWPEPFRSHTSPEVQKFKAEHASRLSYFKYLQWLATEQLQLAQSAAIAAGMSIGIYLDLAVGVDQGGSEVWSNQDQYCLTANVGAPPDKLALEGQNWGFPPMDPRTMHETGYALFAQNLRSNMELAGAVRFDHCVALLRLWWIPRGRSAADGAYVAYPLAELLGVLALESCRNDCLVIGEDLGTVPDVLTQVMHENHVYSYRVLYFENDNGGMIAPNEYPKEAVSSVSTHDLPTLASWWNESDIDLRVELDLLGSAEIVAEVRTERSGDKQSLLNAMTRAGIWPGMESNEAVPAMSEQLNEAIHVFLASSRSAIMMCQAEDMQLMLDPVNVPGTFDEYPNWQRKLDLPIEGFFDRPEIASLCLRLEQERK